MLTVTEERLLKYIEDRARENIKGKSFYKMTDILEQAFWISEEKAYEVLKNIISRKNIGNSKDAIVNEYIDILDRNNFDQFKISVKASNVFLTMDAYRLISAQVDNPLHLGVTEAGVYRTGTVKSAIALGGLLLEGIGDTMRISLAAEPEEEIKIGFDILKSLGIRSNGVNFIACPSCSRQEFDVIRVMMDLEKRLEDIREPMDVSVIGCKVNGPGEAKESDIGVVGASPNSLVYKNGEKSHLIDTTKLADEIEAMVRQKVAEREAQRANEILRVK